MRIRLTAAAVALAVLATPGCSERATDSARSASSVKTSSSIARSVDLAAAVRWWWQRAASMPEGPYVDPRLCGLKQPYRIWLLGGGAQKGEQRRACMVPAHRPILAPVVNELLPAAPNASHPPLRGDRMSVTLDGERLTPISVTNTRPYAIAAVAGNPVGLHAGKQTATDRGYWVLIRPGLAPGHHRLTIHAPKLKNSRSWLLDSW